MLLYDQFVNEDVHLAVWKMDETEDELWNCFHEQRAVYEQEIKNISNKHRRLEYLTVRLLLSQMIHQEPIITYSEEGKPSLQNCPLHISISHTNSYVTVITSQMCVVGIDIEMKKEKIYRVRHKFLSSLEQIDMGNELDSLLLHWCAKETVFKMSSIPLPEFSEDIIVKPFEVKNEGSFDAYETKTNVDYHLFYHVSSDYVMTYSFRVDNNIR